ncbi:hypothetical protein HC823_01185 [Candidatus Gracilibacteria bacterium]|nr:hypothetical protein [Candidatus Gracilibacteria bacterium]
MKFITRSLETDVPEKFIFQQKNGRDVLKGDEIADQKLDLANEMKALTQDLSSDVLESLPNEKDLQLVNPDAIHEFVSRHLPGGLDFDEAEIKKIVVKRKDEK